MDDVRFIIVMDKKTARKMDYIAEYSDRSRIKEILWACKQYIKDFESKNGEISQQDQEDVR